MYFSHRCALHTRTQPCGSHSNSPVMTLTWRAPVRCTQCPRTALAGVTPMALFVVRHRHRSECYPTRAPGRCCRDRTCCRNVAPRSGRRDNRGRPESEYHRKPMVVSHVIEELAKDIG
jgi:hypothetical protein